MKATLVAVDDVPDIRIDKPIILVGRNDDCDVAIDSKKVSRLHCCIAQMNDHLLVRDLGSTNGVRVNGQRVTESRLCEGDEVSLAHLRFRVRAGVDTASAHRPRITDSQIEAADEPIALSDFESDDGPQADRVDDSPPVPPAEEVGGDYAKTERPDAPAGEKGDQWINVPDPVDLAPASDLDMHGTPNPES